MVRATSGDPLSSRLLIGLLLVAGAPAVWSSEQGGLLAGVVTAAPAAPPREADTGPEAYRWLLQRYRAGEWEAAVAGLMRWSHGETLETTALDHDDGAAAVVLHTETALASLATGTTDVTALKATERDAEYHLEIAEKILKVRGPWWPEGRALHRKWLLAVGVQLQGFGPPLMARALRYFEVCLRRYPRDASALLAIGSIYEMGSLLGQVVEPDPLLSLRAHRKDMARRAESHYRKALEADPDLVEARLRWGRLLSRRGKSAEAEGELARVLNQAPGTRFAALANLFLGDLHERTGRLQEAVARYRIAVEGAPELCAGFLALSQALNALGRRRASGEAALMSAESCGLERDPWIDYHYASWDAEPAVTALRQWVRP